MSSEINCCPNCGTENGALSKFCNGCGQPLPQKVTRPTHCPGCGALLSATGKFCNECGQKIECDPPAEKKPIHYRCTKCGAIKDAAVAFCEECGGAVSPVYAGEAPTKKATDFVENLKGGIAGKVPSSSFLFGKRKKSQNPGEKKKQWWIIALAVLVIGGAAGGIGTAVSESGAANRKAEDFIAAFEKAGYTMSYDDNGMEDLQEYCEGVNGIKTMAAYDGEGSVNGVDTSVYAFYYIACESEEAANIVYDALLYEEMYEEHAVDVYDDKNKARMDAIFTRDYSKYNNPDQFVYQILSRRGNVVIYLMETCLDDGSMTEIVVKEFKSVEAIKKLGF